MKKIAFFVEGQTEQIFIQELITNIYGSKGIGFHLTKLEGKAGYRKVKVIKNIDEKAELSFGIYIYDSSNDDTVKSDIIHSLPYLKKSGFSMVFGIRDVFPSTNVAKAKCKLKFGVPTGIVPISLHLSIMEIESWFLAEENHYCVLNKNFDINAVNIIVGFDIRIFSTEGIANPAQVLNDVYHLKGLAYKKDKKKVERTVFALDYENLYLEVRKRISSLDELISNVEQTIFPLSI